MSVPIRDLVGWVASLLTLVTLAQRRMVPLRLTAILANAFFIAYGAIGHFPPVLALLVILLPVNSAPLAAGVRRRTAGEPIAAPFVRAEVSAASPLEQIDAFPPDLAPPRYSQA